MSTIDLDAKIPNNVNLKENKRLCRALEKWQPAFIDWSIKVTENLSHVCLPE